MRVFIKKHSDHEMATRNAYAAYDGFKQMGFEIIFYREIEEIMDIHNKEDVVVSYIGDAQRILEKHGVSTPNLDYPEELESFLGRRIWKSKLSAIANVPENWNVFVKPVERKRFTGVVVRGPKDLIGCGTWGEDPDVLCSDIVNFVAEWRCFVRYGNILDIRRYRGDWRKHFDPKVVEAAVAQYASAPRGYAIDFGLTDKGETLLIEVNEGYSVGYYGLFPLDYAKLLSARWAELTETEDECNF